MIDSFAIRSAAVVSCGIATQQSGFRLVPIKPGAGCDRWLAAALPISGRHCPIKALSFRLSPEPEWCFFGTGPPCRAGNRPVWPPLGDRAPL